MQFGRGSAWWVGLWEGSRDWRPACGRVEPLSVLKWEIWVAPTQSNGSAFLQIGLYKNAQDDGCCNRAMGWIAVKWVPLGKRINSNRELSGIACPLLRLKALLQNTAV
jgi:hypothetical protein